MSYVGQNPRFNTTILTDQTSGTPANPASGSHKLVNRNGQLYLRDSSGSETPVGSVSGVNYISNPNAEGNTTGWATYDDAPDSGDDTKPVNGTGGTPSVTWTRNTSSPLRGVADFKFSKDAVNRQGQGVAYAFTIPRADYSKQLTISFDVDSDEDTAYVAGDLTVYLIRDTGGTPTLVTPAYTSIAASGATRFQTSFVSTTDDDWRLCIHVASVNASAYDVYFDNFQVGPIDAVQGAPVSDWQFYTPTFQGLGTTTVNDVKYMRVGSSIIVSGSFTTGTVTATEARIGLPSGLTIEQDQSSASNHVVGEISRDAASGQNKYNILAREGDTYFRIANFDVAGAVNPLSAVNGSAIFANTEYATFYTTAVPIAQWAGSTVGLTNSRVEYASNSSTTNAADTTSFVYGPSGSVGIPGNTALTDTRKKRVRFQTPIQPTDKIVLEFSQDAGVTWIEQTAAIIVDGGSSVDSVIPGIFSSNGSDGTGNLGIGWEAVNSTDVDVVFGRYAWFYFLAGVFTPVAWNSGILSTTRWRVVKSSNPLSIGRESENILGTTTNDSAAAGFVGETKSATVAEGAAVSLATGTAKTVTSISLTPGDWELSGDIGYSPDTTTSFTLHAIVFSKTTNSLGGAVLGNPSTSGEAYFREIYPTRIPGGQFTIQGASFRCSLSTTTTIYLVALSNFTVSTNDAYGYIQARRVR